MVSACYAQLECTRLLIAHGGNVSYTCPGDNSSILYMLATCFRDKEEDNYGEGDYVATADLLLASGAPMFHQNSESGNTALDVLRSVEVKEGTRKGRERRKLIDLLEQRYWGEYGKNPFLSASSPRSPQDMAQLLMEGAANGDNGRVDITKVRSSIAPNLRAEVLGLLRDYRDKRIDSLLLMLLAAGEPNGASPRGILAGGESGVISKVAEYGRFPGRVLDVIKILSTSNKREVTMIRPRRRYSSLVLLLLAGLLLLPVHGFVGLSPPARTSRPSPSHHISSLIAQPSPHCRSPFLLTTTTADDDTPLPLTAVQRALVKFKARPSTYLIIPVVAALVGWITNWLAVQMIFYPIKFRGIPLFIKE